MWPAALQAHADVADALRANFQKSLRDHAANLLTHFQNGGLYFQQVLANLEYQGDPNAGALFGRFKNVPLVIVSAGPSLDRNPLLNGCLQSGLLEKNPNPVSRRGAPSRGPGAREGYFASGRGSLFANSLL